MQLHRQSIFKPLCSTTAPIGQGKRKIEENIFTIAENSNLQSNYKEFLTLLEFKSRITSAKHTVFDEYVDITLVSQHLPNNAFFFSVVRNGFHYDPIGVL